MNIAEGALLYKYCKMLPDRPNTLIEIGRKYGGSTVLLAANLRSHDRLCSVDTKMYEKELEINLSKCVNRDKIELLTGASSEIGKRWTQLIDLILIDGDHSYKGLKTDINIWLPYLKRGGYAFFHDVVGKKEELWPLMADLLKKNWLEEARVDSLLCLRKK